MVDWYNNKNLILSKLLNEKIIIRNDFPMLLYH